MFNFLRRKTLEQKAVEHLAQYAKEISKDKLGPLGVVIKFTNELKENKIHQEVKLIIEDQLNHSKSYYMCASLMLLSYHKSGIYDSLDNDVDIEELARGSYVACSQIISNDDFIKLMSESASNFSNICFEEEKKYLTAWENWLNNLDLIKSF